MGNYSAAWGQIGLDNFNKLSHYLKLGIFGLSLSKFWKGANTFLQHCRIRSAGRVLDLNDSIRK